MIDLIEVSSSNERAVALKLQRSIATAWPDVATSMTDHVRIMVGIRMVRELDILVTIELETPHVLGGSRGDALDGQTIQATMIAIEVKQLDPSRFTIVGPEIFPDYGGGPKRRGVVAQVEDCCIALRDFKSRYGTADFFVHGVAWLTEVDTAMLEGVNPLVVGREAGWPDILAAAGSQSQSLYGPKTTAVRTAIATVRKALRRGRQFSSRDRKKANALCTDVIVESLIDELANEAGKRQLRLTGRGGSGKTTTLTLLAKRLASVEGERVLVLTFHRALRGDIEHLVDSLVDDGTVRDRIRVESATTFFLWVLEALDAEIPRVDGLVDFNKLPAALASALPRIDRDREHGMGALLAECEPDRFGWDYVFIDEAQDWMDSERDVIRALYGSRNVVLADGLEQLVRRQTSCDWNAGLKRSERRNVALGQSLRMTRNLAGFANAFARASGLPDWKIEPFEKLPGGRVVICLGGRPPVVDVARALGSELSAAHASPVDALFCIPPPLVEKVPGGGRCSLLGRDLTAAGYPVWDACDERTRDLPPADLATWRIVQYDSCRGLEGWITVACALDQLVAQKRKHPNLAPGEVSDPEAIVRRWLLMVLTRAVQMLVITIDDPESSVVETLRAAAEALPKGVVEWTTPEECAGVISRPRDGAAGGGERS